MPSAENKKTVLFLCTGNSCRSQMAEGMLKHYGGDKFRVVSAGTAPVGVNPRAVQAMGELGIDISGQTSDLLTREMLDQADLLITLCGDARDSCPVVPGSVEKRHWPLEDPAGVEGTEKEIMSKFRLVRDQIADYVQALVKEQ